MSVHIQRDVKCYRVVNGYDCGSFFVAHGDENDNTWVKVSVISDFGDFGFCWTSTGVPWDHFLSKIGFDYTMNKFMGKEFFRPMSVEDSCIKLKKYVINSRQLGLITKERARAIWESTDPWAYEHDPASFHRILLYNCDEIHDLELPDDMFKEVNQQAVAFWEKLWPEFIKAVETEMGGKKQELVSAAACDVI